MPYFISILFILISPLALSAGTVDFLKIDNNMVLFSTTEIKASASPVCVATENTDMWAVSLKSESGRAIYSLLVTAMAKDLGLDVQSANDCADVEGLERASGVNIIPVVAEKSAGVVEWAGYTNPMNGKFAYHGYYAQGAFFAATRECKAKYPKSRAMLWDDYLDITDTYPNSYDIWFVDAVQSSSHGQMKSYSQNLNHANIIFKNGQDSTFTQSGIGEAYDGNNYSGHVSCYNWLVNNENENENYKGTVMTTEGRFEARYCSSHYRIACVK